MRQRVIANADGTFTRFVDDTASWNAEIEDPIPIEVQTAATNRKNALGKVVAALTNNQAFLTLAPPTTAQAIAQVRALTRQVNVLLRVAGERLDDISDT